MRGTMLVLVPTGNPPSLRFGHPDVTTDDTAPPRHAHTSPERRVAIPSGSDIRVPPRTLSAAKQGEAERPGAAGAPAGAEEGYSVPTHPAPVGTRTITAFRAESMRPSFSKRKQPLSTREHKRGAASHTGDSASFVRAGSAEKLSLPRRTQPGSTHARGRHQPDRGWPS